MSWEDALKSVGDDYVIMTKVRRFMVKMHSGHYIPREAITARSLIDKDGKIFFHEELGRKQAPSVA